MNKNIRKLLIALAAYLVLTAIFGIYAEVSYRRQLLSTLLVIGKDYAKSGKIEQDLKEDANLHSKVPILAYTPPTGWLFKNRINEIDEGVLFYMKNYSLPENKRFTDTTQCKRFGIDPSKRTDDEIVSSMLAYVW